MDTAFRGMDPIGPGSHVGVVVDGVYIDFHNYWRVGAVELTGDAVIQVHLLRPDDGRRAVLAFAGVREVGQVSGSYDGRDEDWTLFGQIDVAEHRDGGLVFALEVGVVRLDFRVREVRLQLL